MATKYKEVVEKRFVIYSSMKTFFARISKPDLSGYTWTDHLHEALTFKDASTANQAIVDYNLKGMKVLEMRMNLMLEITEEEQIKDLEKEVTTLKTRIKEMEIRCGRGH